MFQRARIVVLALILSLLFGGQPARVSASPWQAKVESGLLKSAAQEETEFLVSLQEQADLRGAASLNTRAEKGAYVYQRLTEVAEHSQRSLLAALHTQGVAYRSYWVANMVWVRGGRQTLELLARRNDVARIYANPSVLFHPAKPVPKAQPANPSLQVAQPGQLGWNLQKVGAPEVWAAGYSGQGVVIGGQDTGYDWRHPALKPQYRGWDGTSADHNYNWHDSIHSDNPNTDEGNLCGLDSQEPCDDGSHGTHTMGTMVGDDGQGNQVGMAPGARWIGCRNMEDGWGTPQTYAECFQWFLAPTDLKGQNPDPSKAPDVINNSWGCPPEEGCEWDALQSVIQNVRAAGILVVVSAGNAGGQGCSSVNDPPAIYDASFTVGSTDSQDKIASSSSRGPADWTGRPKPNVSAPGVGVVSSVPGGAYSSKSGTSMAAPHVAGLAALLLSAQPGLSGQVDAIEDLIEQSAVPLVPETSCGDPAEQVPNNVYGWGRIDALAALKRIGSLEISKRASAAITAPGDAITYTLTVAAGASGMAASQVVVTDTLPAGVEFVTATEPYTLQDGVVRWEFGSLAPAETRQVTLTVRVPEAFTASILINQAYGIRSATNTQAAGAPVITLIHRAGDRWLFFPIVVVQ